MPQTLILSWPKDPSGFFHTVLWKLLNKLFGHPNTLMLLCPPGFRAVLLNRVKNGQFLIITRPLIKMSFVTLERLIVFVLWLHIWSCKTLQRHHHHCHPCHHQNHPLNVMICHADLISYGVHKDFLSKCGQKNKLRQGVTSAFYRGNLDWLNRWPLETTFFQLFIYLCTCSITQERISECILCVRYSVWWWG